MIKHLKKDFLKKNPDIVAKNLLGKIINRKINNKTLKARIVETEAYFGKNDPASRARQNGDLRATMKMKAGTILIYGVHNNWLLNFVTGDNKKARAVLIRAIEPLNFHAKSNGPGLLTKALKINKSLHKKNIFKDPEIKLTHDNFRPKTIISSFRIGVTKDLDKHLRFYIKDNLYVSRKSI